MKKKRDVLSSIEINPTTKEDSMGKRRVVLLRDLGTRGWAPAAITDENSQYYKKWELEMKKGSCRGYRVETQKYNNPKVAFYRSENLLMVEAADSVYLFVNHLPDPLVPMTTIFGHAFFPIDGDHGGWIPKGISWYRLEPMYEVHETE